MTGCKIKWFPIETAPKGDKLTCVKIQLFCPGRGPLQGWWDDDSFNRKPRPYWRTLGAYAITTDRFDQPTHWAPLPDPPEPEQ